MAKGYRFWWNAYSFAGSSSFILAKKLKALKQDLEVWNKEVFRNIYSKKKDLLDQLQCIKGDSFYRIIGEEKGGGG